MKIQTRHTTILLRAIILMLVIATQLFIPVAGRPLVCGTGCGEDGREQSCTALADTEARSCDDATYADDCHDKSSPADAPGEEKGKGCFPHECPCCAALMLPATLPLTEAEQVPETIFSPALLGDPIVRHPLPLDHPPC